MGKEKFVDSSILDKAILFATNAHKNTERRGKGMPYIVHPMEVVSIVSNLTNDQEILAAAALHDTVEDTDVSIEDIKREFGERVAKIVADESDKVVEGKSEAESWKERKQFAIDRLAKLPLESKYVALGDKLSNMRTIAADFAAIGDKLWDRFHVTDPREHEWHYRGLAESLKDLARTEPYKEFIWLIDDTFAKAGRTNFSFEFQEKDNIYLVVGEFNRENSALVEKDLMTRPVDRYHLDFEGVTRINFAGIRTLLRLSEKGYKISVYNAINKVAILFYRTGVTNTIRVNEGFRDFDFSRCEESGAGYTATSYNIDDNDSMLKLYEPFISKKSINREKRVSSSAIFMGVPTPMSGNLVKVGPKYGISFERILSKKSYSRLLEADPDNYDGIGKDFANISLKLHSLKCTDPIFENYKEVMIRIINDCPKYDDTKKKKLCDDVAKIPDINTCIHGDLHIGNVIRSAEGDDLFIDMADFGYGDPRFDLSMVYMFSHDYPDENARRDYHVGHDVLMKFWDSFIKYYLNTEDQKVIDAYVHDLQFFVGLRGLYIADSQDWSDKMISLADYHFDQYYNEK